MKQWNSWNTQINKAINFLRGQASLEIILSCCEPFTRKLKLNKVKQKAEQDQFHFISFPQSEATFQIVINHLLLMAIIDYFSCMAVFQIVSATQLGCNMRRVLIHAFLN